MLCDMEGASGIFLPEHTGKSPGREELYEEGRRLMTADVNAAAQAALDAGVDELTINDTHAGGGRNVLWNDMLVDRRITYDLPQVSQMMPRLDETFDGLILLGHHAMAGTMGAFLDHTWSGRDWFDFQINGMSVGEVGIETCYAGHWDVPLILVQGDRACCAEVGRQFPDAVTAEVKVGVGRNRASGPPAEIARQITAEKVAEAVAKAARGDCAPFKPTLPMTCRFTATNTGLIDPVARKLGVRRINARTVEADVERQCDVLTWLVE